MTSVCNYSLELESYTVVNALLFGNCIGHFRKAVSNGVVWHARVVHVLIAVVELFPVIGQVVSIFEMIIVKHCSKAMCLQSLQNIENDSRFPEFSRQIERLFTERRFRRSTADLSIPISVLSRLVSLNPFDSVQPDGVKFSRGGRHGVLMVPEADHLVFKRPYPAFKSPSAEDYSQYFDQVMTRTERAIRICEENNLFLLHVPLCKRVTVKMSTGDDHFIVQERVDLEDGSFDFQQAFWTSLSESRNPQIRAYSKELLFQLAIFQCKMPYSDGKYDNFPITKSGRASLFDFDEEGRDGDALIGITKGLIESRSFGLFKMVPLEWFDEMCAHVIKHLPHAEIAGFKGKIPALRAKAQQRETKRQLKRDFLLQSGVTQASQPVQFGNSELLAKIERVANCTFSGRSNFWDIVTGRKVACTEADFYPTYGQQPLEDRRQTLIRFEEALKQLQEQGKILRFKVRQPDPNAHLMPAPISFFC